MSESELKPTTAASVSPTVTSSDGANDAEVRVQNVRKRALQAQRRLIQILSIPLIAIIAGAVVYAVRTATGQDVSYFLVPAVAVAGSLVAAAIWIGPRVKRFREALQTRRAEGQSELMTADELLQAADPEHARHASKRRGTTPPQEPTLTAPALKPLAVPIKPLPKLNDYETLDEIGRGTLGVVYRARDVRTKALVALKWCSADKAHLYDAALNTIDDPELFVPVVTAGVGTDFVYAVSEYQDAGSLAQRLNDAGRMSVEKAARLVRTLCRAVDQLHKAGLVHGRLKPTDVLFTPNDQPVLGDLSLIASEIDETDPFRPPERETTTAGDIYRLGGILYAALTTQAPLRPGSSSKEEPVAPRKLNANIPHPLQDICLKCLSRQPRARYTSIAHLAESLDRFLAHLPIMGIEDVNLSVPVRHDGVPQAGSPNLEATVLSPPADVAAATTVGPFPQFPDYEIVAELGRGGMGCVYKAQHKRFGRMVALKTVLTGRAMGRGEVARFQAEIHSAARLDHPGIVPVYEAGESEGQHYFTMALVDGNSLADRIKHGAIDPQQAVYIVSEAAHAVAFAHRHGVIHRDIKPGNILLDRAGSVRVADFGLARQLDVADILDDFPADQTHVDTYQTVSRLTVTGAVLGTPAYMAPEQALDTKRAKEPADIWALGAVLYACLTGRPPFIGANAMDTLTLVIEDDPPPLRQLAPQVDPDLEAICLKCLTKDPLQRYASTEDFVADLDRWRSGRTPHAARLAPLEQWQRWDAAYPEVLPLTVGILAPWLCGVQEGIFLGTMLAASRLRCRWPRLKWVVPACILCIPLLVITRFAMDLAKHGPEFYRIGSNLEGILVELAALTLAGPLLGFVWCIGSLGATDHDRRWTFHSVMLAALAAGGGLYLGYQPLGDQLRRMTDVTWWDYQPVWQSFSELGGPSLWLILVAGICVVAGMLLAVIFRHRKRGGSDLERRPLIGQGVYTVAAVLSVTALLVLMSLALAGIRPYGYIKLAYQTVGPAAATILILPLGFSAGVLLSHALYRSARGDDAASRQARFIGRVAAALAGLMTLAVVLLTMPESRPVQLDVSGYFGPGPLLTIVESGVVNGLYVSAGHLWPLVFLGKFLTLVVPMTMAAVLASRIFLRSRPL